MAGERRVGSPAFSHTSSTASSPRNPFRASFGGPGFSYSLNGEAKTISSGQCRIYQTIFERATTDPYYIPNNTAVKLTKLSGLPDTDLGDFWDDALEATYEASSPTGSREGFLTRDEFYILLTCLQTRLRMDDELFQIAFAAHRDSDSTRPSPSTTYSTPSTTFSSMSSMIGSDEQRELIPRTSGSQLSTRTSGSNLSRSANRKPFPRKQISKSRSINESIASEPAGGDALDGGETYADGFTEFHSPSFQNRLPTFNPEPPDYSGSGKQPLLEKQALLEDPTSWNCSKCSFPNAADSPYCSMCKFRPTPDLSSEKILAESPSTSSLRPQNPIVIPTVVGGMDYKEAVHFSLPTLPEVVSPDLPEVVQSDLPEVMPEIEAGLEPVDTANIPVRNLKGGIGVQITTQDSDAQALALITAREPRPDQKVIPKKSTSVIKRFGRSLLSSSSKKPEKPEETPLDPDIAASGFSLPGLAKMLGDAASAGDLPLVASIFKLGADANYSSKKKEAYHYAATRAVTSESYHVVEYLLSRGLNPTSAANALHQAIIKGNRTDIAMKLIPHADFNYMWPAKGEGEKTQESCLGALSRMKDQGTGDKARLLRLIMQQSKFDVDKPAMLLESGAEKVALSTLACFTQRAGLAAVESLLTQLGDTYKVPRQSTYGSPYVHADPLACITVDYWKRDPKLALELAQLLLKHGSRLTGVKEKYTPLVPAIVAGSVSGVQMLLNLGADPECVMCSVGWSSPLSPLSYIAHEPSIDIEICRALIDRGAKPWRADEQGRSALYWACRKGNFLVLKYLFMLDMARSNINKCLEAAIDSYNPEVAKELVKIGACATAATWKHAMAAKPIGDRRNAYLDIIDILLATKTKLPRELVLVAIDHQNFWGLSRILEDRNGVLDFDKDDMFSDPRWSGIVCRTTRTIGPRAKKYGWGTRRDLQTCCAYAEERKAHEILALLKSYEWEIKAECEADCGLKLWEDACASTPPHKVINGYNMEVAGGRKGSI